MGARAGTQDHPVPLVSLIMANHNGAAYLAQTLASVQAQTHGNWELLVCDDASGDDSVALVAAAALRDPRIRLLPSAVNTGPSGARNRGLAAARGDWIAIVDSDDLMHPRRIEALLQFAREYAADIVADDMIFFGEMPDVGGRTLLQSLRLTAPILVDADVLLRSEDPATRLPSLGYLKPMIRRARIGGLRYDTSLTIGEDLDFLLRLLLQDLWLLILPEGFYLYRRHARSLSYRHSGGAISALLAAQARLVARLAEPQAAALGPRFARRKAALDRGLRFEGLVMAIKARRPRAVAGLIAADPVLVLRLGRSLAEGLRRRFRRAATPMEKPPLTLVLATPGADVPPALLPDVPRAGAVLRLDVPHHRGMRSGYSHPPAALWARMSLLPARHDLTVLAIGPAGEEAVGYLPPGADIRLLPALSRNPARPEPAGLPPSARLTEAI